MIVKGKTAAMRAAMVLLASYDGRDTQLGNGGVKLMLMRLSLGSAA
jgi:hypothetical protein